jgi:y4mF family transcriptional regulator
MMEPMQIRQVDDVGDAVRQRRKALGLTQAELAAVAGVGIRFVSELERGKPTAELSKALQVLSVLGLNLHVTARPGDTK